MIVIEEKSISTPPTDNYDLKEPPLVLEGQGTINTDKNTINQERNTLKPTNSIGLTSKSVSFKDIFKTFKADPLRLHNETEGNLLEKDSFLKLDTKKSDLIDLEGVKPFQIAQGANKSKDFWRKPRDTEGNIVNSKGSDDLERAHFLKREGDWICVECKNMNFERRKKCNRCDKLKFGFEYLQEFEITEDDIEMLYFLLGKEDWKCELCKNLNFGKRIKCHRCGIGRLFCDLEGNFKTKALLLEENKGVSPFSELAESGNIRNVLIKNNHFSNTASGLINYQRKARIEFNKKRVTSPKINSKRSPIYDLNNRAAGIKKYRLEEEESEKCDSTLDHLEEKPLIEDEEKRDFVNLGSQNLKIVEAVSDSSPVVKKERNEEKIERKLFLEEERFILEQANDRTKSPCLFEDSATKKVYIKPSNHILLKTKEEASSRGFSTAGPLLQQVSKERLASTKKYVDRGKNELDEDATMKNDNGRINIKFPMNKDRLSGSGFIFKENDSHQENTNLKRKFPDNNFLAQNNNVNNKSLPSKPSILKFNWQELKKNNESVKQTQVGEGNEKKPIFGRNFHRSRSNSKEKSKVD